MMCMTSGVSAEKGKAMTVHTNQYPSPVLCLERDPARGAAQATADLSPDGA